MPDNVIKKFHRRYSDLIRKYRKLVKDMMADPFPNSFHAVVLSCLFSDTGFVTFYQLMLVVLDVMHEADTACSIRSNWLCYPLFRFLITAYIR